MEHFHQQQDLEAPDLLGKAQEEAQAPTSPFGRLVALLFVLGLCLTVLGGVVLGTGVTGPGVLYAGLAVLGSVILPYTLVRGIRDLWWLTISNRTPPYSPYEVDGQIGHREARRR